MKIVSNDVGFRDGVSIFFGLILLLLGFLATMSSQARIPEPEKGSNTSPVPLDFNLSLLEGPTHEPLWNLTLSQLLLREVRLGPSRPCLVFSEAKHRVTYQQLYKRTLEVAKGLMAAGINKGDHIGIMAGNCPAYVELLFAASHVGAPFVVFNNTYTASELVSATKHSGKY